jgi:alpha-L-rhamnosidase
MQTQRKPYLRRGLIIGLQCFFACGIAAFASTLSAQAVPALWHAQWIAAPDGPSRDYDVVYFRKALSLPAVPGHFIVDVSADTRFELHVNGRRVGAGPSLGDVQHWRYETFDLTPYLRAGDNEIAAVVWNFGTSAPIAQMSSQTAFLLSAEDAANASIDTGNGWQASHEAGRTLGHLAMKGYYAAGPSEVMDGAKMNWDWDRETPSDAGRWQPAKPLGRAGLRGARDSPTRWILEKDALPPMQYAPISAGHVVRVSGLPQGDTGSLEKPLTIPAHADVTILLDREALATAFPSLQIDGGQQASVNLTYAEALYDADGHKGNRNEISGRHIAGVEDHILSDGQSRTYRTLWWRTWRYLQLEVKTSDQPLTIQSVGAFYTAYPFTAQAHFDSNDPELTRIWDVGWRTAQLCSHETYMDTPYWEQLQYVGDTRIQALISYAVTGDDRLGRQALMAYRDSQLTDGLTQSRYPSSLTQIIPPFSLLWVGMLHDHWMYGNDASFDQSLVPGTRGVLDWFSARQRPDGLLSRIEWWPFVDWSPSLYVGGEPPQEADGGSSVLTLQFIQALQAAAELEDHLGEKERATRYREQAERASSGLIRLNWDEQAGLLADTPAKKSFSQQANSLAVLLDVIPKEQQRSVMNKVLASSSAHSDPGTVSMAPASYYFRFYLARAMVHAGLGDEYIPQLEPWRKMLALGLSTWAENPEPTRSDSHAWSAHPTLDLLTIVAGIAPGSPGFESVRITPHLGTLQHVAATMPTPKGPVAVRYTRENKQWKAAITLPPGLSGELSWHDRLMPLHPGDQEITLP